MTAMSPLFIDARGVVNTMTLLPVGIVGSIEAVGITNVLNKSKQIITPDSNPRIAGRMNVLNTFDLNILLSGLV